MLQRQGTTVAVWHMGGNFLLRVFINVTKAICQSHCPSVREGRQREDMVVSDTKMLNHPTQMEGITECNTLPEEHRECTALSGLKNTDLTSPAEGFESPLTNTTQCPGPAALFLLCLLALSNVHLYVVHLLYCKGYIQCSATGVVHCTVKCLEALEILMWGPTVA